MPDTALHLVKVPLRADRLVSIARRRGIPLRELDDGYLAHCFLTELWQERAPSPFVLRGSGRALDVWGYSSAPAALLIEHARAFGDPSTLDAFDDLEGVLSREMPWFESGRRLGFRLRACPVVRLAKAVNGHRAGAEVDAFLAKCFSGSADAIISREEVYRAWLMARLASAGVHVERVGLAGMARTRLIRRTQGAERHAARIERPDVHFEGELVVENGIALRLALARGIGRHRAFGFGALFIVPPGMSRPGSETRWS